MRLPLRTAIPCLALLAAAATAPSAGAAGWVTGEPLSPPDRQATGPMVGLTPSGDRIVAWEQRRDDADRTVSEGIAARIAPAGGDFGPVQLVSDGTGFDPTLATGTDDTVALAWRGGGKLHIARRTPGSFRFTEVPPLPVAGSFDGPPRLALQGGDVFVTFATAESPGDLEKTNIRAFRLPAGATAIEALPGAGPGGAIDAASFNRNTETSHRVADSTIAVGAGSVHVAWEDLRDSGRTDTASTTTVRRAARPVGNGSFSAPVDLDSIPTRFSRPDRATPQVLASAGDVEVAWLREEPQQLAALSISGGGAVRKISTSGSPFNLQSGLDRAGTLTLAWDETSANDFAFGVFGARLPAGAAGGSETRLTRPNANSTLDDVAVGADGTAIVVPDHRSDFASDSATALVQASAAFPGGDFGGLEEVSGPRERVRDGAFDTAAGAVGDDGRALIAWPADDNSGAANDRIFLSERDAAPPSISGVTVPDGAVPGAPVAFAASAADALSPVTVAWDFGDGSRARGGLVNHSYGAPGTYTVAVTATDGAGNTATERRTLVIAAPSAGDGASAPDRTAPRLSKLKSAHSRFRAGTRATALIAARKKKSPAGTTFALTVDERATLVLSFKGKVRRRSVTVPGVVIRASRGPGAVSIPFSGRVGGTRLAPGSYVATVTAIDGSGNRSRPGTVSFTVVSR